VAGCIENLLAQLFGNFDGFKELNRSPLENRIQGMVHGSLTSMLPLQHIYVAIATLIPCSQTRSNRQVELNCHRTNNRLFGPW